MFNQGDRVIVNNTSMSATEVYNGVTDTMKRWADTKTVLIITEELDGDDLSLRARAVDEPDSYGFWFNEVDISYIKQIYLGGE